MANHKPMKRKNRKTKQPQFHKKQTRDVSVTPLFVGIYREMYG